jgi:hypothetical protein
MLFKLEVKLFLLLLALLLLLLLLLLLALLLLLLLYEKLVDKEALELVVFVVFVG